MRSSTARLSRMSSCSWGMTAVQEPLVVLPRSARVDSTRGFDIGYQAADQEVGPAAEIIGDPQGRASSTSAALTAVSAAADAGGHRGGLHHAERIVVGGCVDLARGESRDDRRVGIGQEQGVGDAVSLVRRVERDLDELRCLPPTSTR